MWGIFKKKEEVKIINREKEVRKTEKETLLIRSIRKLERREVESIDTSLLFKNSKIDYNSLLNEEQKKALYSLKGQYLVIAGAGSGKTRTIVYRTAWLIENGVDPEKILMVTFTRKASSEMRERLKNILGVEELKVTVTTFHSFCTRLIYRYRDLFNLGEFEIMEEGEREKILSKLVERYDLDKKYKGRFYDIETLSSKLSKVENRKLKLEEVFKEKDKLEDIKVIKSEYRKYKKRKNIYEFDDLIEIVVKKFRENENFLKIIKDKIEYLVVDEYQDSNLAQRELLKLLIGEDKNLMVVGDDYQSIYGFRGADFTNILNFALDFPKGQLIKLETNYRSSDEIISYTNRIAERFKLKYSKKISGVGRKGERVHKNSFKDEESEGKFICEKIMTLGKNTPYKEMAILFRNRYTVKILEKLLQEYKIPYNKKDSEKEDGVTLCSLHSAKGLEWEVVFIPTLLEGIFPSSLSEEEAEEEKRLYYVGCSRAKSYLYLSYPKFHYEKLGYFDRKSKFLDY